MKYFTNNHEQKILGAEQKLVHIIIIATKPDIIKQAPLYTELKRRGALVLLCHTGQHHDFRYSGGVLKEFNMEVGANLEISGDIHERTAQSIERFGKILDFLRENGKTPIPYIHGDTFAAMTIGLSSILHREACVHVEAGIRTLTPKAEVYQKFYDDFKSGKFKFDEYHTAIQKRSNLELGSIEPYPEQMDTRVAEAGTGYHAAPHEIDREFLLSEGFVKENIEVVGNSVVDAVRKSAAEADKAVIFKEQPLLKSGEFIPVILHRRETTENERRMQIVMNMIDKMLDGGLKVYLVQLNGFIAALERYKLKKRVEEWLKKYPKSFITTPAITYHRDVVALSLKSPTMVIDSGSQVEELNVLGVPCATVRFGSDRGETFLAGCNVPVPPIDSSFMVEIIKGTINNKSMRKAGNIYGENVAKKIVDGVLNRADENLGLFMTEERRLGLKM